MTNTHWFLLIGGILLARGLTSTILGRSPFTSSIIYLMVGVAAGPIFLNLFHFDPFKQSAQVRSLDGNRRPDFVIFGGGKNARTGKVIALATTYFTCMGIHGYYGGNGRYFCLLCT